MAKLGYTWYPKDWNNSEKVFELTLVERGLYRELIDIAMLNDNKIIINDKVWARKFGSSIEEIESILITLVDLKLIEVVDQMVYIPSCESRLSLVRAGAKGGSKSKPKPKPIESLSESLLQALPQALPQALSEPKEKKVKEIQNKEQIFKDKKESFIKWFNDSKLKYKGKLGKAKVLTATDESNLKKLFDAYIFADFEIAIKNLYKSKWADDNNMQTISHFVRIENFNKYLEQGDIPSMHQVIHDNNPVN